jgi:hypothetical protein
MTDSIKKLKRFIRHLGKSPDAPPSNPLLEHAGTENGLDKTAVLHLMHLLEQTQEGLYTCQETFDLLDEYVEQVNSRQDAAILMPYVKRHLDHCPDCYEAYETLLTILETDKPPIA